MNLCRNPIQFPLLNPLTITLRGDIKLLRDDLRRISMLRSVVTITVTAAIFGPVGDIKPCK